MDRKQLVAKVILHTQNPTISNLKVTDWGAFEAETSRATYVKVLMRYMKKSWNSTHFWLRK
jgi:hypothetical protein